MLNVFRWLEGHLCEVWSLKAQNNWK